MSFGSVWKKRADERLVQWAKDRFASYTKPIVLKGDLPYERLVDTKATVKWSQLMYGTPVVYYPKRSLIVMTIDDDEVVLP